MQTKYLFILFMCSFFTFSQAQTKKFRPSKNMKSLNVLQGKQSLKVGQKVYTSMTVHGSVGITAKAYSGDASILKLVDTHFAYKNKQKKGMTGGDRATKTFIFEALKEGTATLYVEEGFRGDIEQEHEIEVMVEK